MSTIGNNTAVSRTKKIEMPSTPTNHRTPSEAPAYERFSTNWYPPKPAFMVTKTAMLKPKVMRETTMAVPKARPRSKRWSNPKSASKSAPAAGTKTKRAR